MAGLELLAAGRDADVFALGGGRVLRRYRDGSDAASEAELMAFVAGHGYPVPAVYVVDGADMEMELLDGPTMFEAISARILAPRTAATMLADLHNTLHALPTRSNGSQDDRIIHLDLHPENVMVVSRGPVVIDWRNAREDAAELDIALTAVILAQLAVDEADERGPMARTFLKDFLANVHGDPARQLDAAVAARAADGNITAAERDRLPAAAALVRMSI